MQHFYRASRVRSESHCFCCNKSPQKRSVFQRAVLRFDNTACFSATPSLPN